MAEFVPHAADYAADASSAGPGVGFVGCDRRSRVLRVRVANRNRHRMRVECPHGCGVHEAAKSMARPLRPDEPEPELVELPPHTYDPAVPDPNAPKDPGSGRRQVSDAAIFDAIRDRDVSAREVADAVGYGGTTSTYSFMRRLKRLNARAAKEGAPEPFHITPGSGGRPALIRRAAA